MLGCMKGTFVLKKDGLVKKTICVTGVELPPPEELRNRSTVTSRLRPSRSAASGRPPGFKLAGTQHLVCYERPGGTFSSASCRNQLLLLDSFLTSQHHSVSLFHRTNSGHEQFAPPTRLCSASGPAHQQDLCTGAEIPKPSAYHALAFRSIAGRSLG